MILRRKLGPGRQVDRSGLPLWVADFGPVASLRPSQEDLCFGLSGASCAGSGRGRARFAPPALASPVWFWLDFVTHFFKSSAPLVKIKKSAIKAPTWHIRGI